MNGAVEMTRRGKVQKTKFPNKAKIVKQDTAYCLLATAYWLLGTVYCDGMAKDGRSKRLSAIRLRLDGAIEEGIDREPKEK